MNNVMGIILTGGKDVRLKELTENRSSAAIPIWGKYRAIDFALSNMVNSGITKVGVITQYRYRSLMDHLIVLLHCQHPSFQCNQYFEKQHLQYLCTILQLLPLDKVIR